MRRTLVNTEHDQRGLERPTFFLLTLLPAHIGTMIFKCGDHFSRLKRELLSVHFYLCMIYLSILSIFCSCATENNHPPQLFGLEDQRLEVNLNFQLEVTAYDEDEDFLTYSYMLTPPPLTETQAQGGVPTLQKVSEYKAIFSWTPGNADVGQYSLTLIVRDDVGMRGEETLTLNVVDSGLHGGQVIRFIQPVGEATILNLRETPCLETDVVLQAETLDASELQVILDPSSPIGSTLTPAGPKRYRLSWCPTPTQIGSQTNFPFLFRATNTRGFPTIEKRYLVRLRSEASQECPGAPPTIMHTPPAIQRGIANLEIQAQVVDDIGIKSAPTLSYQILSLEVSAPSSDPTLWTSIPMQAATSGHWVGLIPPAQNPNGVKVFYQIIVSDDDDLEGAACDHYVESEVYSFSAYWDPSIPTHSPICTPCIADIQCGEDQDFCLPHSNNLGGVCGSFCSIERPCPEGYQCTNITSVESVQGDQCVSVIECGASCSADIFDLEEENQSQIQATPLTAGSYEDLTICSGDFDFYSIAMNMRDSLRARVEFENQRGDLDLIITFINGQGEEQLLQSVSGNQNFEEVNIQCVSQPTTAYLQVFGYEGSENEYALMLDLNQRPCAEMCTPDSFEGVTGNDSQVNATPIELRTASLQGKICESDVDFYSLRVEEGQRVEVRLDFIDADGDLNLEIFDQQFTRLSSSITTGRDLEVVTFMATTTSQYFIKVFGVTSETQNEYSLSFGQRESGCMNTRSCPIGQYCNGSSCVNDLCMGQCVGDHVCVSELAGLDPTSAGGRCASSCFTNSDCRTGNVCKSFEDFQKHCVPMGTHNVGEECVSYSECADDMICFPTPGGYCARGGCNQDFDCPNGTSCEQFPGGNACVQRCDTPNRCTRAGYHCEDLSSGEVCVPN